MTNAHICHRCRRLNRLNFTCRLSRRPIVEHARAGDCPDGKFSGQDAPAVASPPIGVTDGSAAWAELHTQAHPTPEWFAGWLDRLGTRGCSCGASFGEILRADPADFSSENAFFECGARWHNEVNRKLGKPVMGVEEARERWQSIPQPS